MPTDKPQNTPAAPLSPKAIALLVKANEDEVQAVINRVNDILMSSAKSGLHRPETGHLIQYSTLGCNWPVREEVINRFRKVGWSIQIQTDQRDGDYYIFKANSI